MRGAQDDRRHDYLIVGGGVAGCTLAYELCQRGRSVLLLEADRVGEAGASAVPVALANPYRGRSARASPADLAGLAALRRLAGELERRGLESGWHEAGVLRIAPNAKRARAWQERGGVRWLAPHEVPEGYHAPFGAFLVERGGFVEPGKHLRALVSAARRRGLRLVEDCRVEALAAEDGGVAARGSRGTFRAGAAVLCTGAAANPTFGLPALELIAGEVIALGSAAPMPLPLAGAVYGARAGERVYAGGNHRPAGEQDPDAPARLQAAMGWFVPALRGAALESVWTGVRARNADYRPLATELRPGVWFLGALGGRGFLCGASLAAGLAAALEERTRE